MKFYQGAIEPLIWEIAPYKFIVIVILLMKIHVLVQSVTTKIGDLTARFIC